MTIGFLFAAIATMFWSATNIIDKYLVSRFSKDGEVGGLLLLSGFFPAVLLPIAYLLGDGIFLPTTPQIGILMASGVLAVCWMYFYFKALFDEDVSIVMPLFQLTPIFALLFAFVALRELPAPVQIAYGAIIVAGSLILSVERSTGTFKTRLIVYTLTGSALIALTNTLFKYVALDADFWVSIFWQGLGTVCASSLLLIYAPFRNAFLHFMSVNWGIGLALNALNETFTIVGNVLFAYAILLAPLALVQTTEAYQPIFVFTASVILAVLFPKHIREDISKGVLVHKTLGITVVVLGSYLLLQG